MKSISRVSALLAATALCIAAPHADAAPDKAMEAKFDALIDPR
jgi:hypothetical protein